MKHLRKHTQIIADRAAIFASFSCCNEVEQQAAKTAASNCFNQGGSTANSISQGYKVAMRWKAQGIARVKNNVIDFHQRVAQMQAEQA